MYQTEIQNQRAVVFANGAKVEIYVTTPYARYIDIGAMEGVVSFNLQFGVFRGENDKFQGNDSYFVETGGQLSFSSVEFRPDIYHEIMGEGLSYLPTSSGGQISDFTSTLLTKKKFRITGTDDYGNDRTLTIYNASINTWDGIKFTSGSGVNNYNFVLDCLYDDSDQLYLLQDAAGYNFEYVHLLGDTVTDILLGDPTSNFVLGDPLSDSFTEDRL